ncbi:MAG: replicative DNA helicase [Candidatus Pacebacteria bacterium]|jgi:replicative DNA helicase|nr:replicative DNA helicase [Candidatus Paceibacterota bacterium]
MKKAQDNILRVPPQNLDAERAVLGSIMLRPGALNEISDLIMEESFYAEKHKLIYRAMLELALKNEPIDLLSLSTKLKEKKLMDAVGGMPYLTEIAGMVPSSTNIRHYAGIVQKKFVLRSLIEAGDYVAELGMSDSGDDIENILDDAEKKMLSVVSSPKSGKFINIKETLSEAWERLERLHETKGELRGVPTGFIHLDTMLSGLQKSDLVILAARPSMGKTTLALDIARLAATNHNIPVGIFSLEMGAQQLVDRMLAAESQVNAWNLRTGKLSAESEFAKIRDSLDRLSKAPIFIDDTPGATIMKMKSVARKLKVEHGLGLVIVDYLQLMTTSKNYDSMVNQVTEISRSLKSLARELDVPVLALSQLSRAVEARGGRPRLSDLRDSGSIEQDADVVMFIHREDKYKDQAEKTNIAEILIEKHRNGPTGKVDLYFDEKKTTFLSLEKSTYDEFSTTGARDDFGGF